MILRIRKTDSWWLLLKLPLRLALVAALAIGAWTLLSPLGAGILDRNSKPAAAALPDQARIASLEQSVGTISRDIDVVSERVRVSMQQAEQANLEHRKQVSAEIAALKERFDAQAGRAGAAQARGASTEIKEMRASLTDLTAAHGGAVAAITQRLDRIEATVGRPTNVARVSAEPVTRRVARKVHSKPKKRIVRVAAKRSDRMTQEDAPFREPKPLIDFTPIGQQRANSSASTG